MRKYQTFKMKLIVRHKNEILTEMFLLYSIEMNEPPKVETVATTFRQYCYQYRDSLTAGILVAGWDKYKGGQVYILPLGGMLLRQKVALSGSGSSYIYGFVDTTYRENMQAEEAVEFIKKGT